MKNKHKKSKWETHPITLKNMPRCNGRPQVWHSTQGDWERLRIIYPDGKVEYRRDSSGDGYSALDSYHHGSPPGRFYHGCTSDSTQRRAQINAHRYSLENDDRGSLFFIGYL